MTLPPSFTDVLRICKPLTDVVNAIAVFQNQTTTIYSCVRYHILVSGNVMRTCVNGTWSGTEPACHLDSVMPKPYLVLLIVSITVLVFGVWIPADFYRFRQKKKECREKQQRIQMIKRIGPMHVKMFAEPSIDGAEAAPKTSVRFGISSIIAFFKFAKKGKHKRHSVSHARADDSETASDTLHSPSDPSTSATPLAIIQERNYESTNETSALNDIAGVNSNTLSNDDYDDHIAMPSLTKTPETILVNSKNEDLSKTNDINNLTSSSSFALGRRDNCYSVSIGGGMSKSFSDDNWKSTKLNKDMQLDDRKISDPSVRNQTPLAISTDITPDKGVDILQPPRAFNNSVVPNTDHNIAPSSRGFNSSVVPRLDHNCVPSSRGFISSVVPSIDHGITASRGCNKSAVGSVDHGITASRGFNKSAVGSVDHGIAISSRGITSAVSSLDPTIAPSRRATLPPLSAKSNEMLSLADDDECK